VPISSVAGTPLGSDGRMPSENQSAGSVNPPTAGQFQSLVSFGGSPGLTRTDWETVKGSAMLEAGTTAFDATVAGQTSQHAPQGWYPKAERVLQISQAFRRE
jgi:hypothetical protein